MPDNGTRKSATRRRDLIKATAVGGVFSITGCLGEDDEPTSDDDGPASDDDDGPASGDDEPDTGDDETDGGEEDIEFPDPTQVGVPSPAYATHTAVVDPGLQTAYGDPRDVDVSEQVFDGYVPMAAGFIQGEVHTGYQGVEGLSTANHEGMPLQGFMTYGDGFWFVLVVREGAGIEDWEDIEGKNVTGMGPRTNIDLYLTWILERELGVDDINEVTNYEYMVGTPTRLSGMEAGNIDVTVATVGGGLFAEEEGFGRIFDRAFDHDELDFTMSYWVTLGPVAEEQPELVSAIQDGLQDAHDWFYEESVEDIVDAMMETGEYPDYGRSVYEDSVAMYQDNELLARDPTPDPDRAAAYQDLLIEMDLLDEDVPSPEEFTTDKFI